jgi:hypothetical protein
MKAKFLIHCLTATALATGGLLAEEPNIRVCVQLIELSHPELTKLLGEPGNTGTKLHPAAMALTRDGRAKLIDTSVITTISKIKATVESIAGRTYPTDPEPSSGVGWGRAEPLSHSKDPECARAVGRLRRMGYPQHRHVLRSRATLR